MIQNKVYLVLQDGIVRSVWLDSGSASEERKRIKKEDEREFKVYRTTKKLWRDEDGRCVDKQPVYGGILLAPFAGYTLGQSVVDMYEIPKKFLKLDRIEKIYVSKYKVQPVTLGRDGSWNE